MRSTSILLLLCAALGPVRAEAVVFSSLRDASASILSCGAQDLTLLASYRDQIASAETVEEARALALAQTRLAREALSRAGRVLLLSESVRETKARLEAFEDRVQVAGTQAEVAEEYSTFLKIAYRDDPDSVAPQIESKGGCHYTKMEIVIILIGLLFGILPGLIFLILLC
jgi:hypothetical protein